MPYTRAQLLDAVRTDHPEFKDVEDNKLFAAIAVDHPDLAKGISELQGGDPQGKATPLPWYSGYFSQNNDPSRTAGQVASDQAAHVIAGIPQAVTGIPSTVATLAKMGWKGVTGDVSGMASDARNAVKGAASPVVTPAKQAIELARPGTVNAPGPDSQESAQAAEGAGAVLGSAVVAGATPELRAAAGKVANVAGNAWDEIKNTSLGKDWANAQPVREAIQNRAIGSLIQPDKKAFDFGADPVEAAKDMPPSASIPAMRRRVAAQIESSQAEIQNHIADRAAAAQEVGAKTGIDVRPFIQSATEQAIADAEKAGNTALSRQIRNSSRALTASFEKNYGGTYLEPEQIIAEKSDLAKNTKFVSDTVGQNLNMARMKLYQAMDGALNRMFGSDAVSGIESPVKAANRTIASNIELDRLLERRQLLNEKMPLTGQGGIVSSIRSEMPEALPKTILNRLMGGGKGAQVSPAASAYEFFEPAAKGPYQSGYQPSPGGTRTPSPFEYPKPPGSDYVRRPSPYVHPGTAKKLGN